MRRTALEIQKGVIEGLGWRAGGTVHAFDGARLHVMRR
jgi:hypothetical protein